MKNEYDELSKICLTSSRIRSDNELVRSGAKVIFFDDQGNELPLINPPRKPASYIILPTDEQVEKAKSEMETAFKEREITDIYKSLTIQRFVVGDPENIIA